MITIKFLSLTPGFLHEQSLQFIVLVRPGSPVESSIKSCARSVQNSHLHTPTDPVSDTMHHDTCEFPSMDPSWQTTFARSSLLFLSPKRCQGYICPPTPSVPANGMLLLEIEVRSMSLKILGSNSKSLGFFVSSTFSWSFRHSFCGSVLIENTWQDREVLPDERILVRVS